MDSPSPEPHRCPHGVCTHVCKVALSSREKILHFGAASGFAPCAMPGQLFFEPGTTGLKVRS